MLGACWRRPELLALELAWRWGFGIFALGLLGYEAWRIVSVLPLRQSGIFDLSLQDPLNAAQNVTSAVTILEPRVIAVGRWLAPLLALAWAIASGLGRSLVLRRLDPEMRSAVVSLILLQLLRVLALGAAVVGWWFALRWAANSTLGHGEMNLVGYFAWAIVFSLGAFTLWALVSWIFSIAPMIAMLEPVGVLGSLIRSLRLGPMTGKLVEVNMALGIVKLALLVLAMVLSAIPLPFTESMNGTPLYLWWAAVTVVYCAASDFFQIARLSVYIQLWRIYHPALAPAEKA
jgi:hypothetical protein